MKIGILGGSFDPVHQGHLYIAKLAIQKLKLHQVWVVPTRQNPLKPKSDDYFKRFNHCQKFFVDQSKIRLQNLNYVYTIDLICQLKKKHPGARFFLIMGSDNLEQFHLWKSYKEFAKKITLAIFVRNLSKNNLLKLKKYRCWKFLDIKNVKIFFTKNFDLSSSQIRKKS